MKKILFLLLTAISIGATAQQVVSTTVKFNNNVTFNDSTFGNPSKVPVTTFEDTLRYTRGAGAGKILASDANGNAYWTNSSSIDTFSGTPVFPSGIKTDTVFTNNFNGTGWLLQLVNDTTAIFHKLTDEPNVVLFNSSDTIPAGNETFTYDGSGNLYMGNYFSETGNRTGVVLSDTNQNALFVGYSFEIMDTNLIPFFSAYTTISGDANVYVGDWGGDYSGTHIKVSVGLEEVEIRADSVISLQDASLNTYLAVLPYKNYMLIDRVDSFKLKIANTQGNGKVLTSDASGNATWQSTDNLFTVDSVATTGDTTALAVGTYTAIIASGTITDLVLQFPFSPSDGDRVIVKFDFAVTTITADGQGKTVYGFPTGTVLGQHREWRYNATTGAWY